MSTSRSNGSTDSVQLSADKASLKIKLATNDTEVLDWFNTGGFGDKPAEATKRYLRLGVLAATASPQHINLAETMRANRELEAAIKEAPKKLADQIRQEISTQFGYLIGDDHAPGALAAVIDREIKRAKKQLSTALEPLREELTGTGPKSLPQVLENRMRQILDHEAKSIMAKIFATDGSSPLIAYLESSRKSVEGVRSDMIAMEDRLKTMIAEVSQQVALAAANTPTPTNNGLAWEAATIDDLSAVTACSGDALEATGASPGHGTSKLGDALIHLTDDHHRNGARVVVECRTGKTKSRRISLDALGHAMRNRDAHAAILLTSNPELLPNDANEVGFRVYWPHQAVVLYHDRDLPFAHRLLSIAVTIARFLALRANSEINQQPGFDQIVAAVQSIEASLQHVRPIRTSLRAVEKETHKALNSFNTMVTDINDSLNELRSLTAPT